LFLSDFQGSHLEGIGAFKPGMKLGQIQFKAGMSKGRLDNEVLSLGGNKGSALGLGSRIRL
jgi:hypothetical protein